jgi:hypothetical protein
MRPPTPALIAITIGVEACWLFAAGAFVAFGGGGRVPTLSFPLVLSILALAFLVSYAVEHVDFPMEELRIATAVIAALVILNAASIQVLGRPSFINPFWILAVPDSGTGLLQHRVSTIFPLGMAVILWWRGTRLAHRPATLHSFLYSFRVGIGMVAAAALAEALVSPDEGAAWVAIPFFGLGLWGLVLSREAQSGLKSQMINLQVPAITVLGILAFAAIFGVLPYEHLGGPFSSMGRFLELFLGSLIFILILPIALFLQFITFLLRSFEIYPFLRISEMLQNSPISEAAETLEQQESTFPPLLSAIIKFVLVAVIAGLALLWLARSLRRKRAPLPDGDHALRESLWSGGSLLEDFGAFLKQMFSPLTRPFTPPTVTGEGGRAIILRVYYAFLTLAAYRGVFRQHSETPAEFLSRILSLFPFHQIQAARITQAFTRVRYGSIAPDEQEIHGVQEDLSQLRQTGHQPPAATP